MLKLSGSDHDDDGSRILSEEQLVFGPVTVGMEFDFQVAQQEALNAKQGGIE